MNKIKQAFEHGKALIPFITCGDPSLELTEQLVYAMEEAGADMMELGIPFSDPTAQGPAVQAADARAIKNGVTTDRVFETVEKIRCNSQIPLVLVTYANVVFSYGAQRFVQKAAQIGVDGLIVPDIPYEEQEEFAPVCQKHGLALISMAAPASRERVQMIAKQAQGFLCCVSALGAAGDEAGAVEGIAQLKKLAGEVSDIPCAAGFEIASPAQAAAVAAVSDGVFVDSAAVQLCGQYGEQCVPHVAGLVRSLKDAVRAGQ